MINEDLLDLAREVGKFNVLVADPAWAYRSVRTGGTFKSGSAQHYPTMSLEEIVNLPKTNFSKERTFVFMGHYSVED